MRKNLFLHLSVLAVLIVLVSACSQNAAYTNAIPSNATAVAAINLKSLAEKAGVSDKDNKEALKKLTDALKSGMNAAAYQQLEAVISDPSKSGLDITAPIYLFSTPTPSVGMAAKVTDEATLKTFLEAMQKEVGSTPLTEENGYNYTVVGEKALVAFNTSTLISINYDGASQLDKAKEEVTALLKQTEENSINRSPAFKKMQKMSGDVLMMISPSDLLSEFAKQINYDIPNEAELKEMTVLGSLSFEKGKVELQIENFTENAALKKKLEDQLNSLRSMDNTFLKYYPQSTLALVAAGVNGKEVYNKLQENEQFRQALSVAHAEGLKSLFDMFQNDVTMGLINVTMNSAPTFLAYADVTNAAPLKGLYEKKADLKLKKDQDIVMLNEDEYVYKSPEMNIFFGVRNKQLYATNDELLYKNIFKTVDPSLKEAPYASEIKGSQGAMVVDIQAVLSLPLVKMLMEFGGAESKTYYSLANRMAYLTVTSQDGKNVTILQLKNKDVNALKQLVDFVKEFAGI